MFFITAQKYIHINKKTKQFVNVFATFMMEISHGNTKILYVMIFELYFVVRISVFVGKVLNLKIHIAQRIGGENRNQHTRTHFVLWMLCDAYFQRHVVQHQSILNYQFIIFPFWLNASNKKAFTTPHHRPPPPPPPQSGFYPIKTHMKNWSLFFEALPSSLPNKKQRKNIFIFI